EQSVTSTILQYVDQHFTEDLSRETLSDLFYFDEDYITRLFKKETGLSFKNYVIEKRLSLAKDLLEHSSAPIHEIATRVGYDNYSYFTRLFKKTYQLTPIEYRNQLI
ncbi:MAG: helix-turn-helix transcriptional regulator, partial [Lachnospiraceae bacterium]|nr:helix-turn-helix transcriptional regulator [Lachnospiraceae bacterium]